MPIRVLFLNVQLCGAPLAVGDVNQLRRSLYDDPQSLKNFWRPASFNRAFFDESTSRIADLRLPCDGRFDASTCNFGSWVDYLNSNAASVLGSAQELSRYKFKVFMAPTVDACTNDKGPGIGFASGDVTYIRADFVNDRGSPGRHACTRLLPCTRLRRACIVADGWGPHACGPHAPIASIGAYAPLAAGLRPGGAAAWRPGRPSSAPA